MSIIKGPIFSASGEYTGAYAATNKPKTTLRLVGDVSNIPVDLAAALAALVPHSGFYITGNGITWTTESGANLPAINENFSESGFLKYITVSAWDDFRISATSTKLGGTKDPSFALIKDDGAGSQGVFSYLFDRTAEEELYFSAQLPHKYKEGTDIYPHVHWNPISEGSGQYVKWGLEYTWANYNEAIANTAIISASGLANDASYHTKTDLPVINGSGKTISSMLMCRIFRDSTSDDDNYGDDASLLEVDFHYEINSLGSEERTVKY